MGFFLRQWMLVEMVKIPNQREERRGVTNQKSDLWSSDGQQECGLLGVASVGLVTLEDGWSWQRESRLPASRWRGETKGTFQEWMELAACVWGPYLKRGG